MHRPALALAALTSVALAAGCTAATDSPRTAGAATDAPAATTSADGTTTLDWGDGTADVTLAAARLVPFDSCDQLLEHYVAQARELVGPWGLGPGGGSAFPAAEAEGGEMMAEDSAGGESAGATRATGEFSTTNVQEEGVDEPDVVKTDGELVVVVTEGGLRVLDAASAEVLGRLDLPEDAWGAELLLDGDDLLVLATTGGWDGPVAAADGRVPAFPATRTTITRVDLTDPADPTTLGQVRLEGDYRSARMVDGTVRVVMESQPTGLSFIQPEDGGLVAEQEALEENRRILEASDVDDWVPHLQVTGTDGASGDVQRVHACEALARPGELAGLATTSVLTLAIDGDTLVPTSTAGVLAAGDTVYASTDRLLVATSPWGRWRQPFLTPDDDGPDATPSTDLHAFDISDPATTAYVGSGRVDGTLLNQFALSEADGVVRVATTQQPAWWGRGGGEPSSSSLVVLAEQDGALVETGRVDGLGVTERIHAVRYLGPDLAAIVTFRETDPLYLVDTSDPTAPTVTGELKIPGFSSYLHPVGGDRLVGIGQDADQRGRTLGLQASLFDVGDLTAPARVAQVGFGEGWSPVGDDHRAFLHWAPTGQVVLPAELWDEEAMRDANRACQRGDECVEPRPFLGALVLREDGGRLVEQGRVPLFRADDPEGWDQVQRALVVGDRLWLLGRERAVRVALDGLGGREVVSLR